MFFWGKYADNVKLPITCKKQMSLVQEILKVEQPVCDNIQVLVWLTSRTGVFPLFPLATDYHQNYHT